MLKKIVNFLFEMEHLRFTPRSGWQRLGIRDPQNVAEHSAIAPMIAFVLAVMEGHKNPCHCATITLFHDGREQRTQDQNAVSKRYNKTDEVCAGKDIAYPLGKVGEALLTVQSEFDEKLTKASKIAHDADRLEMMFEARRLMSIGYADAEKFFLSGFVGMETESGKQIAEELRDADPNDWWKNISSVVHTEPKV
jgi:putative hydrolase of HD superfamily